MAEKLLDSGTVPFQAEGRLLQEFGERLVASPQVALVELIKNSYDADASSCQVRLEDSDTALVVADDGYGMNLDEFIRKWMRIATRSKVEERLSRIYKRRLTGAKGIGRFAVRSLGNQLTLFSVADDVGRAVRTRLTARFDWAEIDKLSDLRDARIDYQLLQVEKNTPTGTILEIRQLKTSTHFTSTSSLRSDVLRIVTPLQGLDAGRFSQASNDSSSDPGFKVALPGASEEDEGEVNLADLVLRNYWARLDMDLKKGTLIFKVWLPSLRKPKILKLKVATAISAGFIADIRFFPRRKGVFQAKGIDGQEAWRWVRENSGVSVVDHGFRIVPYGYEFDDWLHLDADKAHSERNWRSKIAQKQFPISAPLRNRPGDNPALNLPYKYQLVGAVFVESRPPASTTAPGDLIPSMDREGFLRNRGFDELVEFVRAGIEFLALEDKRELDRRQAQVARDAVKRAREDVKKAIEHVQKSPTLTRGDKARFARVYTQLADQIDEVEEYNARSRQNLMTMSLLGVVAGFMTHETKSLVFEMQKAARIISSLAKQHPKLRDVAGRLKKRLSTFEEQLQYAQMFIQGVKAHKPTAMSAAGQIRYVLNRFESFATDHGITLTSEADSRVKTPALPPAVYSGLLLNLFTNALKAVLSATSSIKAPKVAIRAWNEKGNHYLEVSDNGIGIPSALHERIWEPLFTTTSDTGNPLGSGMGLGLSLVKQVTEDAGGKVELAKNPAPGFNTSFRVIFPME
jgi:signal transduction histidine kinase